MPIKPFIMDHPLIQHKLTWLRDKNTGAKEFRELVNEIATLMCYEATRNLPLEDVEIETPMGPAVTKVISGRKLAFVPILRAGMGYRRFRHRRHHPNQGQGLSEHQIYVHHRRSGGSGGPGGGPSRRAYLLRLFG